MPSNDWQLVLIDHRLEKTKRCGSGGRRSTRDHKILALAPPPLLETITSRRPPKEGTWVKSRIEFVPDAQMGRMTCAVQELSVPELVGEFQCVRQLVLQTITFPTATDTPSGLVVGIEVLAQAT